MKKISELKTWVTSFESMSTAVDDLQVIYDFFREGEAGEKDIDDQYATALKHVEELELKNMLRK